MCPNHLFVPMVNSQYGLAAVTETSAVAAHLQPWETEGKLPALNGMVVQKTFQRRECDP